MLSSYLGTHQPHIAEQHNRECRQEAHRGPLLPSGLCTLGSISGSFLITSSFSCGRRVGVTRAGEDSFVIGEKKKLPKACLPVTHHYLGGRTRYASPSSVFGLLL